MNPARLGAILLPATVLGGAAIFVLSFLPWIAYSWMLPDCPECGSGVYLVDYSLSGRDVEGITGVGDGLLVAALGLLIVGLALAATTFPKRSLYLVIAIAMVSLMVVAVAANDALTTWTFIEWRGPIPVGTGYPRILLFETSVAPALYAEIAIGSAIAFTSTALALLQVRTTPKHSLIRGDV